MPEFNSTVWGGGTGGGTSGRGFIYGALRLIAVLRPGHMPAPEAFDDGLVALNEMLESWSTERLAVPVIERHECDVVAGGSDFLLGPGGDLDVARPVRVYHAAIVSGEAETTLDLLEPAQWAAGRAGMWVDGGMPLRRVRIRPGLGSGDRLALYVATELPRFEDLDTEYVFPPGYALALRYNLAVQLAPQFVLGMKGQALLDRVEAQAAEYKAAIKALNMPVVMLSCDAALVTQRFDVVTG